MFIAVNEFLSILNGKTSLCFEPFLTRKEFSKNQTQWLTQKKPRLWAYVYCWVYAFHDKKTSNDVRDGGRFVQRFLNIILLMASFSFSFNYSPTLTRMRFSFHNANKSNNLLSFTKRDGNWEQKNVWDHYRFYSVKN